MRDVNERNRVIGEVFDELKKLSDNHNKEFNNDMKEIKNNEEFSDEEKTDQTLTLQSEISTKQSIITEVMGVLDRESKKVFFATDEILSQGFSAIAGELNTLRSQISMELSNISKELKNATKKLSKK